MPSDDTSERPPTADLTALLEGLVSSGVEFILVGGLAAVAQGAPITTFDVDIVHRQTDENLDRLMEYLRRIDAIHRRPDDKILRPHREELSARGHTLLRTKLGPLDVLAVVEGGRGYEELLPHTVEIEFRERVVRILALETLVAIKRESPREKDRQRLPILEATLRQELEDEEEGG